MKYFGRKTRTRTWLVTVGFSFVPDYACNIFVGCWSTMFVKQVENRIEFTDVCVVSAEL